MQKAVQSALRRARQWCHPPHWNRRHWLEELAAIAQSATCEACHQFNQQQGIPLETFVFRKVLTALRAFYRHEWAYFAVHCSHLQMASELGEGTKDDEGMEVHEEAVMEKLSEEWRCWLIHWAVQQLSERERLVIEWLYWDGLKEGEVAKALGISQQAVSKIKGKAIQKLKGLLEGLI